MKSCKELYAIGPGPSSSHTLGPQKACQYFMKTFPSADRFEVTLYGSLSLTGKGHLTDEICIRTFAPMPCHVTFSGEPCSVHPNTMKIQGYKGNEMIGEWTVYSVGGGAIHIEGEEFVEPEEVYPHTSFEEIVSYCHEKNLTLRNYVDEFENVDDHLNQVLDQMLQTVEHGLHTQGTLPGRLKLKRVACELYQKALQETSPLRQQKMLLMSYAYAASEENASGGVTVTSPTMGASGVMPSLVRYYIHDLHMERSKVIEGLKVASIIGNVFKKNATISGAQGGCQAEIGVACAMGSAFVACVEGKSDDVIEYAAEVGIEHFLGLTCDPVGGYVMIPCIERNSVAVLRAMDAALLAEEVGSIKKNRVNLDMVIHTMNYTGTKLAVELKETSLGGLASVVPMELENQKD